MLDESTRNKLRDRIIDEIAATEERVIELEESTAPIAPDKGLGRLTRLDAMQDKSVREAALAQARASLQQLEIALVNVDTLGFGICVSCKTPIAVERLVALPGSTQCVECAAKSAGTV